MTPGQSVPRALRSGAAVLALGCGGLACGRGSVGCSPDRVALDDMTPVLALRPTFDRVDADGDGALSEGEYSAHAYAPVPFTAVDVDRNGGVTPNELLAAVMSQDPVDFDGGPVGLANDTSFARDPAQAGLASRGDAMAVLRVLYEEAQAAHPDPALPPPPWPGGPGAMRPDEGGDTLALLQRYHTAWQAAGLAFPAGLDPATTPPEPPRELPAGAQPAR